MIHLRSLLGQGGALLIIGPAGIGKTRLASRIMAGVPHLFGQALPTFTTSTYRPLAHALRCDVVGTPAEVASDVVGVLSGRALWIEDLHWADLPTLEVLLLLVSRVPLITTSRTEGTLASHPAVETERVGPLSPRAASALARRLHPTVDAQWRQRLVAAAGGNPLLLQVLGTQDGVNSTLTEAVAERVRRLSASSFDAFGRLALQGRPSPPDLVGLSTDADRTGLVRTEDGLVWFTHALFSDAVLDGLDEPSRSSLRRQLIAVCDDADAARHLLAIGDLAGAASRALAAAHSAPMTQRAELLCMVVDALGDDSPATVRLQAAEALITCHRAADARRVLAGIPDGSPLDAEADLRRSQAAWLDGDASTALEALDRATERVDREDLALTARIEVERIAVLVRTRVGDPELPALAMRAIDLADEAHVERARSRSLAGLALSHTGKSGWAEQFTAAADLAREVGDVEEECAAAYWYVSSCGFYGPMTEAVRLGAEMITRTHSLGLRRWNLLFVGARALHLCTSAGLTSDDMAAALQLLVDEPAFRNRAQVELALVVAHIERGELVQAERVLERGRVAARTNEDRSLLGCASVELAAARQEAGAIVESVRELAALGQGFFGLNAAAESAAIHALIDLDESSMSLPSFSNALTPVLDVVGRERKGFDLWSSGDHVGAVEEFALAAVTWEQRGMFRYGRRAIGTAIQTAERAGLHDRAGALLDQASLLVPIEGTAQAARLRNLRLAVAAGKVKLILSQREAEILGLVGSGRSSRAIAEQLGLATSTVESHIAAAVRKLGCRNRKQAAAMLSGKTP